MSKLETGFFVVMVSVTLACWYHGMQVSAGAILPWIIVAWINAFETHRHRKKMHEILRAICDAQEITIKENGKTVNVLKDDGRREAGKDP